MAFWLEREKCKELLANPVSWIEWVKQYLKHREPILVKVEKIDRKFRRRRGKGGNIYIFGQFLKSFVSVFLFFFSVKFDGNYLILYCVGFQAIWKPYGDINAFMCIG